VRDQAVSPRGARDRHHGGIANDAGAMSALQGTAFAISNLRFSISKSLVLGTQIENRKSKIENGFEST
jgi:hypothetical protein